MNVAVIIAGGTGNRMGADIPKQFIKIEGKPVLVYTLESFEEHDLIDAIEVVCLNGWEDEVWEYADKYNISKLKWITSGAELARNQSEMGSLIWKINWKMMTL